MGGGAVCDNAHKGNAFDETQSDNVFHTLYATFTVNPLEKLKFKFEGNYTESEFEYNSLTMTPDNIFLSGSSYDYDYTTVNKYSDLKQKRYELSSRGDYQLSEKIGTFMELEYSHFDDEKSYIYGELDGSYFMSHIGINLTF